MNKINKYNEITIGEGDDDYQMIVRKLDFDYPNLIRIV